MRYPTREDLTARAVPTEMIIDLSRVCEQGALEDVQRVVGEMTTFLLSGDENSHPQARHVLRTYRWLTMPFVQPQMLEVLVQNAINAQDEHTGMTALHMAARRGKDDVGASTPWLQ